jgi:unsaturated chondroitin disaccharide hydrolase
MRMSDLKARALELMLARIDQTATEPPAAGFPHYADPDDGRWTRSPAGDWTGGFWNGELWLAGRVTGEGRYTKLGREWALALRPRAASETVFRGFLFWYGAALGSILHGDVQAAEVAAEGAHGLATLFNRAARVIPLGSEAEEATNVGRDEANIDGLPGGTPLLVWTGRRNDEPELEALALEHAHSYIALCVRKDGSVCQSATFDRDTGEVKRRYTHKGVSENSTWTRAQAWAMLGFSQAVCGGAEEFRDVAVRVSDWWCDHLPETRVAPWDFDDPTGLRDTSGTAIASASLLKLAAVADGRSSRYADCAEAMVDALVAEHLAGVDPADHRPPGMLLDGCYNPRISLAPANELIWGDYFLFEALAVLGGFVDATEI